MNAHERLKLLTGSDGPAKKLFGGLPDNNLGNSLPIEVGQRNVRVLQAHGDDDHVATIAVSIGYEIMETETAALTFDVAPFAQICWGVGGASYRAELDLFPGGTVINITATSLEVAISNLLGEADGGASGLPGARIRGIVSVGAAPNARSGVTANARRSQFIGTIGAGLFSALIPVPPFAIAVNLMTTSASPTLANLNVIQSLSPINVVPLVESQSALLDTSNVAIPLALGTRAITIENTNPGAANNVRVVFTLAL